MAWLSALGARFGRRRGAGDRGGREPALASTVSAAFESSTLGSSTQLSRYDSTGFGNTTTFGPSRLLRERKAGRRWSLSGVVLGGVLGAVVAAPASWLGGRLATATDGRVLLADSRGTVWSGSAVAVLTGGTGSQSASALPGRVYWTLRPSLRGLTLTLQQACCMADGLTVQLRPSLSGLAVQFGDSPAAAPTATAPPPAERPLGQWPAAWLAGLGAPMNSIAPGGLLVASSSGFTLGAGPRGARLDGAIRIELRDARSRLARLPSLGSYQVAFTGAPDGSTQIGLSTLQGPLMLDGNGQIAAGRLRFRGQARAGDGQDEALAALLGLIGRRQGALAIISIG